MTPDEKIDKLMRLVEKRAVAPVAPVLPVAPIAPVAPVLPINSGDHDVLTALVVSVQNLDKKLDDKFSEVKAAIENVNDGVGKTIADHEDRIRKTESSVTQIKTYGSAFMIALGIAVSIEAIILKVFIK